MYGTTSGNSRAKKALDRRRHWCSAAKLAGAMAREEQGGGEAAVGVGQRDQHEAAARPDVQRVALEGVPAVACAGMVSSL